ncbi:hypothetical protein [Gemmata sp.]|uniref:hypothetical protein n=1 Tax=Gemmata sp. TaxID=1914242 RepID=UPI003F70C527
MSPVVKRIAVNGTLAAIFLAVLGYFIANIAVMFLPAAVPGTEDVAPPDDDLAATMKVRLPLTLAVWGFGFVAVGELILWAVRGNRPPAVGATQAELDANERIIQELLAKADAEERAKTGDGAKRSGHRDLGGESREVVILPDEPKPADPSKAP